MANVWENFQPHPEVAVTQAEFDANPGKYKAVYKFDYVSIFRDIALGKLDHRGTFRELAKNDRFFIVHFIMAIPPANHPFVVNQCKMLEDGPQNGTVDVWAREHYKSVAITVAGTVQAILNDPESTTAIFSYKKPAAEKFLDAIRKTLETPILIWCFPDILYENPATQAPSWSLQGGIRVKRESQSRKEHTVEAFGLIEGQPTGGHFSRRLYDDVEVADLALNPEQMDLLFKRFEMSRNLGAEGGIEQIIGTYYSHTGFLVKLGEKKDIHGEKMYKIRIFPATHDGTINGRPVLFSQEYLDSKKTDSTFSSQQLCNPTPQHTIKLEFDRFKVAQRAKLPKGRIKLIVIDPAGDKDVQSGIGNDSWSMLCVSVNPVINDMGVSDIFIEDAIWGEMGLSNAIEAACSLYERNGRIAYLGVEKVANDTTYEHIRKGLMARGRYLEIKKKGKHGGNLILLSPAGKAKNYRIETALAWPLNNGKLHIVEDLVGEFTDALKQECSKFPYYHTDILDSLSYIFDIISDPTFVFEIEGEDDEEDFDQDPYENSTGRSGICGY